jgi:hypothetical protein
MNRAFEARLFKLEAAHGDPREAMIDEELEARIEELIKKLGGLEAIKASLDGSCAWHGRFREVIRRYEEGRSRCMKTAERMATLEMCRPPA